MSKQSREEQARIEAGREYQQANPDYNPFHSTPNQDQARGDYVDVRAKEILKEQQ